MNRRSMLAAACAATLLLLAACGSDEETADTTVSATGGTTAGTATGDTAAPAADPVTVTGAWARTSPMSAENGAAYMVITSSTDDRLIAASLDASLVEKVEIHETVMVETSGSDMTTGTGMTATTGMTGDTAAPAMEMRPVDAIELPAGTAVELKPGGYHVMLLGLTAPLVLGQELALTLTFENAGTLAVTVPVRDDAP